MTEVGRHAIVACAAGVALGLGVWAPTASAADNDDARHQHIINVTNEMLGLEQSALIELDLMNVAPATPFSVDVPFGDMTYTLDLVPHSIRSAEYFEVLAQVENGEMVEEFVDAPRTLRGDTPQAPGSLISASLLDDGLYALIRLPDGGMIAVEPLGARVPGANANEHIIYDLKDVIADDGSCGTPDTHGFNDIMDLIESFTNGDDDQGGIAGGCGNDLYVALLANDADVEFFNDYGSVQAVVDRIELVMNTVDAQYESDVQITHEIGTIVVRTVEPDPYSSTDFFTLLTQFRTEWAFGPMNGVPRDLAHLWTGKSLNGGVIGVAWDIGAICEFFNAYALSELDFNNNFTCATDLVAHELGHLWNASHCNNDCGFNCSCSTTMRCFILCANTFSASCTVGEIESHRNSRTCLDCGGGGGDPVVATLTSFIIQRGDLVSGNLASLEDSDNDYLRVDSVPNPMGNRQMTVIRVAANSAIDTATDLKVLIEAAIDSGSLTGRLQARNWNNNGRFETIDFVALVSTDSSTILSFPSADYLQVGTGNIEVRFAGSVLTGVDPDGFQLRIDQVVITVLP